MQRNEYSNRYIFHYQYNSIHLYKLMKCSKIKKKKHDPNFVCCELEVIKRTEKNIYNCGIAVAIQAELIWPCGCVRMHNNNDISTIRSGTSSYLKWFACISVSSEMDSMWRLYACRQICIMYTSEWKCLTI